MRVASAVMKDNAYAGKMNNNDDLVTYIEQWFKESIKHNIDILVLPGLIGCLYDGNYIEKINMLSKKYPDILLCSGSYFEIDNKNIYHTSSIVLNGEILLKQRQLYLARWERNLGLSRGSYIDFIKYKGYVLALVISTDAFYPQVSRYVAMNGVDLVLSPMAIVGGEYFTLQLSGLWENVQQNLFFAVESGLKGEIFGHKFHSESIIHAPLEMTDNEDGFLKREDDSNLIYADLDNDRRVQSILNFDVLRQLNIDGYKNIFKI